jgi:ACS family hexuronate transporter-like MFS transporter
LFCGFIGLLWVPAWWFASRAFEEKEVRAAGGSSFKKLINDRRLWRLAGANVLIMALHSLWFNWTTIYFVDVHHMTLVHANQYFAWIPPIAGTLGGFFGGWLAFRGITQGSDAFDVRFRIARIAAPLLLVTAVLPFVQSTIVAVGIISLGFFLVMVILSNLHVLPLHLFGMQNAAFTASVLALSYALLQMVFSPIVGAVVDRFGFSSICIAIAPLPLIGIAILRTIRATAIEPLPAKGK